MDVALYESMYNLMEGMVPEYSGAGAIREPSGSTITGIVPTNTYLCGDGKHVVIGANGDSIFIRLMKAMGRDDMAVVDLEMRVRGAENLRVIDASIFPDMLGGNINAPTMAFADRAADLLMGNTPLSPMNVAA